ncbi:hypothetical protein C3747_53g1 [Trypanosoma cruzi]|uniref:Target of rapamycin (TOR) kinase 1 n=1 Tax=Trypanosoma cruzi TaxID=5693 RepID=A0A2V2WU89_TRYCR|nr:hypothetical protein C3747_53g1 [Trypanosoma cruzi]
MARWWSWHGSQWDTRPAQKFSRSLLLRQLRGVTTVVHFLRAAPPSVRIDVWIDDIRIAGSKSDATLWEVQVLRNADGRHATMEEDHELGATHYTFLGVRFDHTHRAVSLRDEFARSVCAMPSLKYLTIAEMEVMASRFLYAAAIFFQAFMCLLLFHQGSATTINGS